MYDICIFMYLVLKKNVMDLIYLEEFYIKNLYGINLRKY